MRVAGTNAPRCRSYEQDRTRCDNQTPMNTSAVRPPDLKLARCPTCSALPSRLYLDHSHCPVLAPATLAALPSTRAISDRCVFYVADHISSIRGYVSAPPSFQRSPIMHRKPLMMRAKSHPDLNKNPFGETPLRPAPACAGFSVASRAGFTKSPRRPFPVLCRHHVVADDVVDAFDSAHGKTFHVFRAAQRIVLLLNRLHESRRATFL